MEVLERNDGEDALDPIFEYADASFNFINMFFSGGGFHNGIVHHLIYSIVKIHVHEDSLYYHATSGIDLHNPFKRFTQLINRMDWHVLNS